MRKIYIAQRGSRTYRDIMKAVARVLYYNKIVRVSDQIYFTLINAAKYSLPALRGEYTIRQLESFVQAELNQINGVLVKC